MTSPNQSRGRFFSSSATALLALGALPRPVRAEGSAEPRRPLLTDPATRDAAAAKRAPKPATHANPPAAAHQPAAPVRGATPHGAPMSADDLWADLKTGNKRFVAGRPQARMPSRAARCRARTWRRSFARSRRWVDKLRFCGSPQTVLGLAVEANVRQSARTLLENSAILREELGAGKLALVRAVYRLTSGGVDRLSDD